MRHHIQADPTQADPYLKGIANVAKEEDLTGFDGGFAMSWSVVAIDF
jgi:hypothetical protein